MHPLLSTVRTPSDVQALPSPELPKLAEALRDSIVESVSAKGGHLASNLGVVELTIALLRVFSPPRDKLLFDVSHQTYAYKLLTERAERFGTLRQLDGLSGFLKRSESPYDAFGAGHAGTAISAALGFAAARDRLGSDNHVVAVVGDAAMSNGTSLEALNNVHSTTRRLIVVLNDNEMSISQNVGSLARHLGRLLASPKYNRLKASVERVGVRQFRMSWFRRHYYRIETALKSLLLHNAVFEEFGLRYIGPIDGHDLPVLQNALEIAKASDRPVLVHVSTRKGRGYRFAEEKPSEWHGTPAFERETGAPAPESSTPSYSQVMGNALLRLASKDPRIVALTAAMGSGTGLAGFAKQYPQRFFDVGICEGHQAVFAAGLATGALRPVVAVYSTFSQRSVDAIVHDAALQNLPIVFCLDRAGVVSSDGPTHHGLFDLAMLRAVPRLVIMQPRNEAELARMLRAALQQDAPAVIRYPRGAGPGVAVPEDPEPLPIGQAEVLRHVEPTAGASQPGHHVALWSLGDLLPLAEATAELLAAAGIAVTLVDARFVRPLDRGLLRRQADDGVALFATFENAMALGGFGSAVQDALADEGIARPVVRVGWPDEFITHAATNAELLERYGLTPSKTAARIQAGLAERSVPIPR